LGCALNPLLQKFHPENSMQILIYGTINSMALALYALGFAMVYGVSRLPNFAHGALYVLRP